MPDETGGSRRRCSPKELGDGSFRSLAPPRMEDSDSGHVGGEEGRFLCVRSQALGSRSAFLSCAQRIQFRSIDLGAQTSALITEAPEKPPVFQRVAPCT